MTALTGYPTSHPFGDITNLLHPRANQGILSAIVFQPETRKLTHKR
jgi:hypothetical protein